MATNIVIRFIGDTSQLNNAFRRATTDTVKFKAATQGLSGVFQSVGKKAMTWGHQFSMWSFGAGALVLGATKSAIDFEESVNKMTRLAGVSKDQAHAWSRELIELSKSVAVGPNELAEALYFVASSGADVDVAMKIVKTSAMGAAVGLGDVQTVADALTSVINVYGKENITAAEAANVLVAAVREGKGEADEYAAVIGRLTPNAALLGVEFNEIGAAMAFLTNKGLSTHEAATRLNQAFQNLIKPSKQSKDMMKMLGGSYEEVHRILREDGLLAGLRYMRDLTKGNKEAFATLFPNVRSLNAALLLTSEEGAAQADEIFGQLADNTGDLDNAFKEAEGTAKFKLADALATLKSVGVELGEVLLPIVADMAKWFGDFASKFSNLSGTTKKVIAGIAIGVTLLAPLLITIGLIAAGLSALFSPVGLVVAAIVGLGVAAVMLYKKWTPFRNFVDSMIPKVKRFGTMIWTNLVKVVGIIKDVGSTVIRWIGENAPEAFDRLKNAAVTIVSTVMRIATTVRDAVVTVVRAILDWANTHVMPTLRAIGEFFAALWQRIILPIIQLVWKLISTIISQAIWVIKQTIGQAIDWIKRLWGPTWKMISEIFGAVWRTMVTLLSAIWNFIKGIIQAGLQIIRGIFQFFTGVLTGDWRKLWDGIKNILSGVWNTIISVAKFVWEVLKGVVTGAWDSIFGAIRGAKDTIGRIASGMWDGIKDAFKSAINWIIDKWNNFRLKMPEAEIFGHKVGGWTLDTPDIPRLAKGGIVHRPTLALIGEGGAPEVVFPTDNPRRGFELLAKAGVRYPVVDSGRVEQGQVTHITYAPQFTLLNPRDAAVINEREYHWMQKTSGR